METIEHTSSTSRQARGEAKQDLDSLSALRTTELERLYRRGKPPKHLQVLDGHPRGRMLAVRGVEDSFLAPGIRRLSGASAFPWGGKSFTAHTATTGAGINRVHLGGRHNLFPFHTRLGASRIDGEPTVVLDYDLSDNPGFIRKIHDEVREISAGLFLGPAMWKRPSGEVLVLWFALDTRHQAQSIGAR